MKTQIKLVKKTEKEMVRELFPSKRVYIIKNAGGIIFIFDEVLKDTDKQKVKDLLGSKYYVTIEDAKNFETKKVKIK